jgi:cytochrome c-type biogenesis protein CcmH
MSRGRRTWLLVGVAALVVCVAALVASTGGDEPTTVPERARAVASGLRCPVCQNLSVADSPSRLAGEMRAEIEQRLAAGASEEEVRAFFVARYGEWVLLEPTREGLNLLPFLFPLVAVGAGVATWLVAVRRRPRPDAAPVSEEERRRIRGELGALEDAT